MVDDASATASADGSTTSEVPLEPFRGLAAPATTAKTRGTMSPVSAAARDFAEEIAAYRARMLTDRFTAVECLRRTHEEWARALLHVDPRAKVLAGIRSAVEAGLAPPVAAAAHEQLAAAEGHQWEIGTWASGAGEGLASMHEVRTLQLARAWLLSVLAVDAAGRDRVRALIDEVESDPNDIAADLRVHWVALRDRLD